MKKIKLILSITTKFIFLLFLCVICVWGFGKYKDYQEKSRREYIQSLINAEIAALEENKKPSNNEGSGSGINWNDIIQDSVETTQPETYAFTNVQMITSSTFKATLNQEEKTFHLIGVADDGNAAAVKAILENLKNIEIVFGENAAVKGGVHQIYLFENSSDDVNNMVNFS